MCVKTCIEIVLQKMSAPGGEVAERSPDTPNGDVMSHSDEEKERQEYLEINFKYPLSNRWYICVVPRPLIA